MGYCPPPPDPDLVSWVGRPPRDSGKPARIRESANRTEFWGELINLAAVLALLAIPITLLFWWLS